MNAPAIITLAQHIEHEHQAAHQAARTALEHALECGRLLIQAKGDVGHGGWLPWVEANLSFGQRQASNYMRLARDFPQLDPEIGNAVADLSLRDALGELAARTRALKGLPVGQVADVLVEAERERLRDSLTRAVNHERLAARGAADDLSDWVSIQLPVDRLPPPDARLGVALMQTITEFDLPPLVVLETLNELYCRIQNRHQLVTPAGFPDGTPEQMAVVRRDNASPDRLACLPARSVDLRSTP